MTWLFIWGLILWVFILATRLADLRRRAELLERKVVELGRAAGPTPRPEPERAAPRAAAERRPIPKVTKPLETARPEPQPPPLSPDPRPEAVQRRRAVETPSREDIRAWLEENGLAWAGGAALALGGLFLVTYAAQRGLFTPPFRIAAAVVAGTAMLGVSEWLLRQTRIEGRGHKLAAAMAAGAGAATLYGAAWASYWLYAFIPLGVAGALLGLVSFGLLALAFRHGEPLAILAIAGGYLAPMITGPQQWAAPALTGYLALITVTGYGVAAARRWGQAGIATLVGAVVWALAGFTAEGWARVAALAVGPAALAYLAAEWRKRRGEAFDPLKDRSSFALLPSVSLAAGSALGLMLWFGQMPMERLTAAGVGAGLLAVLASVGARRGLIPTQLQLAGYAAVLAVVAVFYVVPFSLAARELIAGALALVASAAGLWAQFRRPALVDRLCASAGGVAALVIAWSIRGPISQDMPWAPLGAVALVLVTFAGVLSRGSQDPSKDIALAIWIWASGTAALAALHASIDPRWLPLAAAGLAVVGAALHMQLGWRGFAAVAVASATASLAALLRTEVFRALDEGDLTRIGLILVSGGSAALVYAAAWIAPRNGRPRESAEALSTGALLIALTGVFMLLRLLSAGGAVGGGTLDPFVEAGLRTVLILAAGLMSAQAVRADSSVIGRWRGQVLLLAGLAHGVLFGMLTLNPLLATWKPPVAGPPLLDSLALAFLAPAALLAAATVRKVSTHRALLAVYAAGAALFAFVWSLMETRRLFQGASLDAALDAVGRAEAGAYAILVLMAARATLWAGERAKSGRWTISAFADEVVWLGRAGAWAALAFALWVFAVGASPWWGPVERPLAGYRAAGLLLATYVAGGVAAHVLRRAAERAGDELLGRASRMTVVIVAFALLNLLVRFAFRRLDMRQGLSDLHLETVGFETWAFSAAWGIFGFGLLVYGASRRSNDLRAAGLLVLAAATAKIFLFDMSQLEGAIRAASFLAVGALLLAAAVIVRRLSGSEGLPFGLGRARES